MNEKKKNGERQSRQDDPRKQKPKHDQNPNDHHYQHQYEQGPRDREHEIKTIR
jgi:hypothetical protein